MACCTPEEKASYSQEMMGYVDTHIAPNLMIYNGDNYAAYNKPEAVRTCLLPAGRWRAGSSLGGAACLARPSTLRRCPRRRLAARRRLHAGAPPRPPAPTRPPARLRR